MSRIRTLQPDIRVTYLLRGEEPGKWNVYTQFQNFLQVSVSLNVHGHGRATIDYPNSSDEYFDTDRSNPNHYGFSAFKPVDLQGLTGKEKEEFDWLTTVLRKSCDNVGPEFTSSEFINPNWRAGWMNTHPFSPLGLVWIDAIGPYKGLTSGGWYGIFTGVITRVRDTWRYGQMPMLTIDCEDLGRWLTLTPIATQIGIYATIMSGRDNKLEKRNAWIESWLETVKKIKEPFTTVLADSFEDFVPHLMERLYSIMLPDNPNLRCLPFAPWYGKTNKTYKGFDNFREEVGSEVPDSARLGLYLIDPETQEPILQRPPTIQREFASTLNITALEEALKTPYSLGIPYSLGTWAIDRLFVEEKQEKFNFTAFRKALLSGMQLWDPKFERGLEVLEKGFHSIMADVYFDGVGNLVVTFPKYDGLPGEEFKDKEEEGHFDTLKYHKDNYILDGSSGLLSWDFSDNENQIVTAVMAPSNPSYVPVGEEIAWECTGIDFADDSDFEKYGFRLFQTDQLFPSAVVTDTDFYDTYAAAVRKRMSARRLSGNASLLTRPDLQIGRTVFFVERGLIFYVTGMTHRFVRGRDFTTTLALEYGRRPTQRIGTPWELVRDKVVEEEINPHTGTVMSGNTPVTVVEYYPPNASPTSPKEGLVDSGIFWKDLIKNQTKSTGNYIYCPRGWFPTPRDLEVYSYFDTGILELNTTGLPTANLFTSDAMRCRLVDIRLAVAIKNTVSAGGDYGMKGIAISCISDKKPKIVKTISTDPKDKKRHSANSRHYSCCALDIYALGGGNPPGKRIVSFSDPKALESHRNMIRSFLESLEIELGKATYGAEKGKVVVWNDEYHFPTSAAILYDSKIPLGDSPEDPYHISHIHVSVPVSTRRVTPQTRIKSGSTRKRKGKK